MSGFSSRIAPLGMFLLLLAAASLLLMLPMQAAYAGDESATTRLVARVQSDGSLKSTFLAEGCRKSARVAIGGLAAPVSMQCPAGTVDCGDNEWCCRQETPLCCGNGKCCPSGKPYACPSQGKCYATEEEATLKCDGYLMKCG